MAKKIQPKAKNTPPTTPIGETGLLRSYGQIQEEKHPKLQGKDGAFVYQEMSENSATISAALYSIEGFLRRVCWRSVPSDAMNEAAVAEAEFLKSCMHDMEHSWADMISDRLSMLVYGFDLAEVVFKYRKGPSDSPRFNSKYSDGRIGWRTFSTRKQTTIDRWDIDDTGNILGCWQYTDEMGERYIPLSRCMHIRTRTYANNPEGRSLLRGAFRSWHFNKRLEEVEAVGLVRALVNLPKFEIPARFMSPSASAAEKSVRASYEKMASLISKDQLTGLVMPSELDENGKPTGYKFSLVGASGAQLNADPVIRRYDARMMMSLASEFMLLGSEKTGSFALAAEKSSNFKAALERFAGIIRDGLNKQVERLMTYNGVPPELWPRIEHDPIAEAGLEELGSFLRSAGSYITPTLETENRLREKASLPLISEEEFDEAQELKKMALLPPEPAGGDTEGGDAEDEDDAES